MTTLENLIEQAKDYDASYEAINQEIGEHLAAIERLQHSQTVLRNEQKDVLAKIGKHVLENGMPQVVIPQLKLSDLSEEDHVAVLDPNGILGYTPHGVEVDHYGWIREIDASDDTIAVFFNDLDDYWWFYPHQLRKV